MQKNTICINCGSIGHRVYDCEEVNSFTIEMGWGRYNNHQITSPYCQESTSSYNYCQESSCTSKIFSLETYCFAHINKCLACTSRIANFETYCSNHRYRCLFCYDRISSLETYCFLHTLPNEQNHLKSLVKEQTNLSNIQEVTKFTTPWNNNCATIIIYQDNYSVFLGLIDRQANTLSKVKPNQIFIYPINPFETKWGIGRSRLAHNRIEDAEEEAKDLREALKASENPILLIHPKVNEYVRFDQLVKEPYVIKEQIGDVSKVSDFPFPLIYSGHVPSNLDSHFKPLDIVKVKCFFGDGIKRFYHYGIVLGNNHICDFTWKEQKYGVRRVTWKEFLENTTGMIFRYHPIIPFKDYKQIIGQLVWAKDNSFWKDNYNLVQRNCAHVAGILGWGINYSEEVWDRKEELASITWRGAQTVVGSAGMAFSGATLGASIALVPATGGLSLLLGGLYSAAIGGGSAYIFADACENKYSRLNNGKDGTIKLINEIVETNNLLSKKSDSETKQLEERYEARIEAPIKTGECIIM